MAESSGADKVAAVGGGSLTVAELPEVKPIEKWAGDYVQISDISLADYLAVKEKYARFLPDCAAKGSSHAVKKKDELGRVTKSNR